MTSSHGLDDTPDWDALARLRAGECTPEEAERLMAWLAAHPLDAAMIDALDGTVSEHFSMNTADVDVERALGQLHGRMTESTAPSAPRLTLVRGGASGAAPRRKSPWVLGGIAAAAAVGAIAVVLGRPAPSSSLADAGVGSGAKQEYRTAVGAVDSVVLADGSRVLLAPASHLVVPTSFGRTDREVTLEGMARFEVQHDAAAPFTVRAGRAVIRDVGTQFTVRSTADSTAPITVAVTQGEVSLSSSVAGGAPTSLRAGDRGDLAADGSVVANRGVVRGDEDAWMRGALVYNATPLNTVRDDLKRWYGLELQGDDTVLATRRLTATFEKQDADQLLRTLALALDMTVQRAGNVVTVRPRAIGR